MATHLEESLQRDIDRIRNHVKDMAGRSSRALENAVRAYMDIDRRTAYSVILHDQYVDEKEKEIDRLCLEFILRQQPIAGPLRFAYSTIKINLEIERVGDYAESIARQVLQLKERFSGELQEEIIQLSRVAIGMFNDAIKAYLTEDAALAGRTMAVREAADAKRNALNVSLVSLFNAGKIPFDLLDPLMSIIRRLERVADQARNICTEVLYMCTGEYAKHKGVETFRILFVDDYNSCRSPMAEAMGNALGRTRLVFSSAGVEPRPVDRRTIDFMRGKGVDMSRMAPKAIHQVPHLDRFQVIVAFSEKAANAFPERFRKIILLDWPVEDPSRLSGDDATVLDAYEKTYRFISEQLTDLVQAILENNA